MLLTEIFDSACEPEQRISPSPGLQEAIEMLQYLADRGNKIAAQRLAEVQIVNNHLSANFEAEELLYVPDEITAGQDQGKQSNVTRVSEAQISPEPADDLEQRHTDFTHDDSLLTPNYQTLGASTWNDVAVNDWLPMEGFGTGNSIGDLVADIPLGDSFDQYQSLLNDPNWVLTGQDISDFAELRRHLMLDPIA